MNKGDNRVVSIVPVERFATTVSIISSKKRFQGRFIFNGVEYRTGWCKSQMNAMLRSEFKLSDLIPKNLRKPGFFTVFMHDGRVKTS